MATGKSIAVGVAVLAAGCAIGWLAAAPSSHEVAAGTDKLVATTAERDDARTALEALRVEASKAHDDAGRQSARVRALETSLRDERAARTNAEDQLAKLVTKAPAGPKVPRKARFSEPGFDEVLAKLDWDSVGEHFGAMPSALGSLLTALAEGKKPEDLPPETTEGLTKHNGPLVTVAVKLMQGKVPGTGANGAFTHPAFMANAMAAALENLNLPLSDAQAARVEEISRRFVAEDVERLGRYDDATMQIKKIEEEGGLRDRFFTEARTVLSAEQLEALSPAAVRDRLQFDLFSSGILLYTVTRPMKYDSAVQFGGDVAKALSSSLRLTDEQKTKFAVIAAEWAAELPKDITTRTNDPLDKLGILRNHNALVSAGQTRRLIERAVNDLQLAGDSLNGARKWGVILMPSPSGGEAPGADDGR